MLTVKQALIAELMACSNLRSDQKLAVSKQIAMLQYLTCFQLLAGLQSHLMTYSQP
jgi:hypothetical protein